MLVFIKYLKLKEKKRMRDRAKAAMVNRTAIHLIAAGRLPGIRGNRTAPAAGRNTITVRSMLHLASDHVYSGYDHYTQGYK